MSLLQKSCPMKIFVTVSHFHTFAVDARLPVRIELTLATLFQILTSLLIVTIVFPWFLIAMVPLVIVFLFLYQLYRTVVREVRAIFNHRVRSTREDNFFTGVCHSVRGGGGGGRKGDMNHGPSDLPPP